MADEQELDELNDIEPEQVTGPRKETITEHRARRAEAKARAAVTVKANAEAAAKAKKKVQAKGQSFNTGLTKSAKVYEDQANARFKAKAEADK